MTYGVSSHRIIWISEWPTRASQQLPSNSCFLSSVFALELIQDKPRDFVASHWQRPCEKGSKLRMTTKQGFFFCDGTTTECWQIVCVCVCLPNYKGGLEEISSTLYINNDTFLNKKALPIKTVILWGGMRTVNVGVYWVMKKCSMSKESSVLMAWKFCTGTFTIPDWNWHDKIGVCVCL